MERAGIPPKTLLAALTAHLGECREGLQAE